MRRGSERLRHALSGMPEGARDEWRALQVVPAGCGGCGAAITAADLAAYLAAFRDQWLD